MRFTYIATVLAVVAKLSGASPTVDPHFFPLDEVNMTFASVPNHSELYRRGDLTPGDTLRCGAWEYDTNGVYAEDAIKEVKKKKGQPKPTPPRTCYWVYCDDNHAKIAWCNEVSLQPTIRVFVPEPLTQGCSRTRTPRRFPLSKTSPMLLRPFTRSAVTARSTSSLARLAMSTDGLLLLAVASATLKSACVGL
ncbi:hypothetical protein BJX70DRAFT_207808 [Aspergillus crustosus]